MTPDELQRAPWEYLGTVGIICDTAPTLRVRGVNGGSEFTVGLYINGQTVMRLPGESVDDMTARVRQDMTLRGHPDNEAVTLYNPHTPPKTISPYRQLRRGR